MKEQIIEAVGVVKRHGTVDAVSGLDLGAHRGEVRAVLGANGAGTADGDGAMRAKIAAGPDAEEEHGQMAPIRCDATLCTIGSWILLRLPTSASAQLPSRGMTMVEGTINGARFHAPLEPDGTGSHWFRVDDSLRQAAGAEVGDTVTLEMEPATDWPEPAVPADVQAALAAVPQAHTLWLTITPTARWDWIRWIRATNHSDTRRRRIEVACSKLTAGLRRPCCFNRNLCTEPAVSQNGVLHEPTQPRV
jgi:Bacteriocin-protection, YdeI or OmpD-Associated/Domain of unknown function (DUF1905)